MATEPEQSAERQQARFACAACEHRGYVRGSVPPLECPRCAAQAIVMSKPDGSLVVPEIVREARSVAMSNGLPVGFAVTVVQGKMTVEQAKTKGNRNAVAQRIAERHEIPLKLAYQVADGKLRIRQALERTAAVSPAAGTRRPWRVYGWFVAAGAIFLVGLFSVSRTPPPETPIDPNLRSDSGAIAASRAKQKAKLERNEQNQITYVEGDSPQRILDLYCASSRSKAVEIVRINTNRAQAIFEKAGHSYAFDVHYDTSDKLWFAGGTGFPVQVKPIAKE